MSGGAGEGVVFLIAIPWPFFFPRQRQIVKILVLKSHVGGTGELNTPRAAKRQPEEKNT
jgi:hypothetical protein